MLIDFFQTDFNFEDERGTLTQLIHTGYQQINVITSKKGVQRGGHYHRLNREAFYIVAGRVELTAKQGEMTEQHIFEQGEFFGIGPNVSHEFLFLENTVLVSMYDHGVEMSDGTKDIFI